MLGYTKVTRRMAVATVGGVLLLAFAGCARQDQNALVVFGTDSVVTVAPLQQPASAAPGGTATATSLELVSFNASAAWGLFEASRHRMAAQPSGEITEYIAYSIISTMSPTPIPRAPPLPPSPIMMTRMGTGIKTAVEVEEC